MNCSLTFQKTLFFHTSFDFVYFVLIFGGIIHRIQCRAPNAIPYVVLVFKLLWIPLENSRIRMGYKGNI